MVEIKALIMTIFNRVGMEKLPFKLILSDFKVTLMVIYGGKNGECNSCICGVNF